MTEPGPRPIRHHVVVDVPIDQAFTLFTDRFGDFKPREHNLLAVPIAETVFEPRVGGHIYDRGIDGSECRWPRVLVSAPPHRVVFSSDIDPHWQIKTDPTRTKAADRTRVDLEHRHLDRHGPDWRAVADGVDSDAGWPLYLRCYTEFVAVAAGR